MYIDLQMRVWSSNMRQIGAAQSAPFNHANGSSVYPHTSNLREQGKYSISAVYPWHLVGSIRISCCLVVGHDLLPNGPAFPLVFPPCLLRLWSSLPSSSKLFEKTGGSQGAMCTAAANPFWASPHFPQNCLKWTWVSASTLRLTINAPNVQLQSTHWTVPRFLP